MCEGIEKFVGHYDDLTRFVSFTKCQLKFKFQRDLRNVESSLDMNFVMELVVMERLIMKFWRVLKRKLMVRVKILLLDTWNKIYDVRKFVKIVLDL